MNPFVGVWCDGQGVCGPKKAVAGLVRNVAVCNVELHKTAEGRKRSSRGDVTSIQIRARR